LESNWRQWKDKQVRGRQTLKTIKKEEVKKKGLKIREWTEEYKDGQHGWPILQVVKKSPWDEET